MPTLAYAPRVLPDVEARVDDILRAAALLETGPDIGRPVGEGVHERVIGRGANGYIARHRRLDALDPVVVLAVRARRERPFDRPR